MFGFSTLAIAASLAAVVAANHGHGLHARSHQHIRRAFSGQATYYQTGTGACGKFNSPSDKIVALNSAQYGGGYPGPQCWKMVRICKSGSDNCHNAQIVDECPTCDYGSLDMSQSLFEQFASTDAGVFPITWTFVDGDGGDDKPTTTSKKPTPTPTPEPEPTTTWKPEPTTTWTPETTSTKEKKTTSSPPPETTSTPEPTTSSTSSTPTTTSTTEVTTSSASTSSEASLTPAGTSAAPSASASSGSTGGSSNGSSSSGSNLVDANEVVLALGRLAYAAQGGQ